MSNKSGFSADVAIQRLIDGSERFLQGQARVAEGRVKFVGAIYEIQTGRVRFLGVDHDYSH
jgi:hypothetical protein